MLSSKRIENTQRQNHIHEENEQAVITHAIHQPAQGQQRTSNESRNNGAFVSGSASIPPRGHNRTYHLFRELNASDPNHRFGADQYYFSRLFELSQMSGIG